MSAPLFTISDSAAEHAKALLSKRGKESAGIKIGVRTRGCSGLSYVIDFEADPDPEFDLFYQQAELGVVVDIKSAKFLKDTTLDYNIKNLMEGGFVFDNPQAVRSCGCGTSFTSK